MIVFKEMYISYACRYWLTTSEQVKYYLSRRSLCGIVTALRSYVGGRQLENTA